MNRELVIKEQKLVLHYFSNILRYNYANNIAAQLPNSK